MKIFCKEDHTSLAAWAADCAERVLPIFETVRLNDDRPRKAIETCRTWIRTGEFKMAVIRIASLDAHAAARGAKENNAACFAARAAGQAVAAAHVPQHAFGAAYYALKAVSAAYPAQGEINVFRELDWQLEHIAKNLREEASKRVVIEKGGDGVIIRVRKDKDF
jgi:hypothetical protein